MAETKLNETYQQVKQLIIEMPLLKKLSILITIAVSVSVIVFLVQLAGKSGYQVLYSNLDPEDIGAVTAALDQQKISYQVQSETRSVMVPGGDVLKARLNLAKNGLPQFGGVGFEIFDQASFGMTDFEQRLNYQRALQGELTRTITEFAEVDDCRVHLVIPEKNMFLQSAEETTASIIIRLEVGQKMREETVQAIVHLVSSSVPNLLPKNVTVVDTSGQLLTAEAGEEGVGAGSVSAYRKKRDVEHTFEQKVRSLLEPIVGYGKVKVRVTADLDFTAKETTEEKFDPESIATRSETISKNKEKSSAAQAGGEGKEKDDQSSTVSYEVSKQVQRIVSSVGDIKTLSVAVLVDGLYKTKEDGKTEYTARTPEEIKNYEDIIKSAIGFSDKRGDQLKVMNLAFQNPEDVFASAKTADIVKDISSNSFYMGVIVNVVIAIVAILIILFVIRPLLASWNARKGAVAGMLPGAAGALMLNPAQAKHDMDSKAMQDPADMVRILRKWLE